MYDTGMMQRGQLRKGAHLASLGYDETKPELPPEPNQLPREFQLDFETTGIRWWAGDVPVGAGLWVDGKGYYLAWGHRGGGNNISEEEAKRYIRDVRNRRIANLNTRFEVHMAREWAGADFEAQGCSVTDVGHWAALLDDHRLRNSLEAIVADYLDDEQKVTTIAGRKLDSARMADYPASIVAIRAIADVRQVAKLQQVLWPKIQAEDLTRVLALEERVIYPVCFMEKQGALIDVELLNKWVQDSEQDCLRLRFQIQKTTGIPDFNPNSTAHWEQLFKARQIIVTETTASGQVSRSDVILKRIKDDVVQKARRLAKLESIRSKYLLKMQRCIGSDGILRYALHQLRAQKNPLDHEKEAGTISGRFSSTEIADGEGVNQQQVMKTAKQRVAFGYDEDDDSHDHEIYPIRQLYIPPNGQRYLSSDAMQIEYRLFAHYAASPKILEAYKKDLKLSFHKMMHAMLRPMAGDVLTYRRQKDLNFARIYGAQTKKMALMLEFITPQQFQQLYDERASDDHPLLADMKKILQVYDREIPEAGDLLRKAQRLAKERGFVKTILGRRTRFPDGNRAYKALNGVIQGSAADIAKTKACELYENRKELGFTLCFVVHDENDGYVVDEHHAKKVDDLLNQQSFETKVPILWDTTTGANWKEC